MRRILLATAVTGVALHSAAKGTEDPSRLHHRGMSVILHNGHKQFDTVAGDTPLDPPKTFVCESAGGCLISFNSRASANNNAVTALAICSQVDGHDAQPGCAPTWDAPWDNLQSVKVGQGSHTVQTVIRDVNGGGTVYSWEADYTIYEKGN